MAELGGVGGAQSAAPAESPKETSKPEVAANKTPAETPATNAGADSKIGELNFQAEQAKFNVAQAPEAPKEPEATVPTKEIGEKPSPGQDKPFYKALNDALAKRGQTPESVFDANDPVDKRIMEEYGALFMAGPQVKTPPVATFDNEQQVKQFQQEAGVKGAKVGGVQVQLQPAALNALQAADAEAKKQGLTITPRGTDPSIRSYADTVKNWKSRVDPGLNHWVKEGRLPAAEADKLRKAPLNEQVRGILELEKKGLFFSQDFKKSILQSVAAPGASQHLSMLALDVKEFSNPRVREVLAKNGWYQTVASDLPHFTYLGVPEKDLPGLGLRPVTSGGQKFWVPDVR